MIRRAALSVSVALLGLAGLAAPANAASPLETFLILQTTNSNSTVIGNGPIHATGKDIQIDDHHDVFKFAAGSLLISHKAKAHKSTFDKVTCVGTDHEIGTYAVTGGTGAYAKAKGHGQYILDVIVVGCSPKKPPIVLQVRIDAIGPLSF